MAKAVKGETKTVAAKGNANGSGGNANGSIDLQTEASNPQLDPDILKRVAAVRSHVRESFGKITMAMMMLPRYRSQTLADLQHLVLEPLIRDRVAIAYPGKTEQSDMADISGVAIWASVSDAVDLSIREQIKAGVFPVRLKAEDWTSGEINWLLDIIAPDKKTTASVIANFKQLVKEGSLRLHPLITRLVDEETLKKMGAEKMASSAS
jgi:cytolysin-activating lysine-acyltransferase